MTDEQFEILQKIITANKCEGMSQFAAFCRERHEKIEKEFDEQKRKIDNLEVCINKHLLSIHRWLIGVMTTTVLTLLGMVLRWWGV